ncbi:MAG: hypothetical protein FWC10_09430 [Lentimicrobiaceae bacterium]|nr:hypothetical protein [Lentimicrobiaceae bacterium]
MKTASKTQFLIILCILALMFTSTACCREEDPKCGEVTTTNGWITSPKWMVNVIDNLINDQRPIFYIMVYSIEYNGQIYFKIVGRSFLGSALFYGTSLFTCYGEYIPLVPLPPNETDLWRDLFFSENRSGVWHKFLSQL